MKLCDRCSVSGCCLDYLGVTCKKIRKRECPDVKPNRAELISNMDFREMANGLIPLLQELCEDGIPSSDYMCVWLSEEPENESLF